MRLTAILAVVVCALAIAGYFLAMPHLVAGSSHTAAQPTPTEPVERSFLHTEADRMADESDAAEVRRLLEVSEPTDRDRSLLINAAGRRYMRRKLALQEGQQAVAAGKAKAESLDELREEVDLTRKLCDMVETLGLRSQAILAARADFDLERRLFFGPPGISGLAHQFAGHSTFSEADLLKMETAFLARFARPLPVSTRGGSAFHRAMGFDHRGRFDVAVSPDNVEGVWVRNYLIAKNVPFFAFRAAVKGQATGAHIHIGPSSGHLLRAGD